MGNLSKSEAATEKIAQLREAEKQGKLEILKVVNEGKPTPYALLWIPDVNVLQTHPSQGSLRANSPESAESGGAIGRSLKRTGGDPVYDFIIWLKFINGVLTLWILDGNQRKIAKVNAGGGGVFVKVLLYVDNETHAFEIGLELNSNRYENTDDDFIAILSSGLKTLKQVAEISGKSISYLERLDTFVKFPWLQPMWKAKFIKPPTAKMLTSLCGDNPDKLKALENTLSERFQYAEEKAAKQASRIRNNPKRKWDELARRRAKPAYFSPDQAKEKWTDWKAALDDEGMIETREDKLFLRLDGDHIIRKEAVEFGDLDEDWKKAPVMKNLDGRNWADWSEEDYGDALDNWSMMGEIIAAQFKRRRAEETAQKHPLPTSNPTVEVEEVTEPKPQETDDFDFTDGGRDDEDKGE